MDPNSGRITRELTAAQARAEGLVPLSAREAAELEKLPEPQRAGALITLRAMHPAAKLPGISPEDHRKLRNAVKAARRSRRGR